MSQATTEQAMEAAAGASTDATQVIEKAGELEAPPTTGKSKPEVLYIALDMENGEVGIMEFAVVWWNNERGVHTRRLATREAVEDEIKRSEFLRGPFAVKSWRFVELSELPQERTYRPAWRYKDKKYTIDMDHAKRIHQTNIFRFGHGGVMEDERLREAIEAPEIANAQTPAELKAYWPSEIENRNGKRPS